MYGMAGMADNFRATRRMMAKGCYRALLFQVYALFPLALLLSMYDAHALAEVIDSVGAWSVGLNAALGGIIGTYKVQATKDDAHRREQLNKNGSAP